MKANNIHTGRLLLICLLFTAQFASAQGRVVINEYMPWTSNNCATTSEFVELLNFGPGPVDISCYILTDGDYSITIPGNTILQPGQFYVISGQNFIPAPCANINGGVVVDLNWNTCGCTSAPIPTVGHGLFTDGGGANEQVVLLDPQLNVVDAVIRDLPAEPSSLITSAFTLDCNSQTFDLDNMAINYETLGMSLGAGNSFARKLDGDCGWVKDPQQSAGTSNTSAGDNSEISYNFSYVNAMDCSGNSGSVHISVKSNDYSLVFPMKYTLAMDADSSGVFDFNDDYTTEVDSTAPDIFISNLTPARYRLTIESKKGCYLQNFEFQILQCIAPLSVQLTGFRKAAQTSTHIQLEWTLSNVENVQKVIVEKSNDNMGFTVGQTLNMASGLGGTRQFTVEEPLGAARFYRLKIITRTGQVIYSSVIFLHGTLFLEKSFPNPVTDRLTMKLTAAEAEKAGYAIYHQSGAMVMSGNLDIRKGTQQLSFITAPLAPGIYQFNIRGSQPISFRFVKY